MGKRGVWNSFPNDLITLSKVGKYSAYFGVFVCAAYKLVWMIAPWLLVYSIVLTFWIGMKIIPVMRKTGALEIGNCYAMAGFYLMLAPIACIYAPAYHVMEADSWWFMLIWVMLCMGLIMIYVVVFSKYLEIGLDYVPYGIALALYITLFFCSVNIVFDKSQGENVPFLVYDIKDEITTDSDGDRSHLYYAIVDLSEYGGAVDEVIKIPQSKYEYYRAMSGENIILVTIHPGVFGRPWMILPEYDRSSS